MVAVRYLSAMFGCIVVDKTDREELSGVFSLAWFIHSLSPSMAISRTSASADDLGKLILRILLSVLLLLHGVAKIIGGPAFIIGLVTKAGLPGFLGYLVYVGEVIAPLLILLGLWTRLASLIVIGNMIVAIALVHQAEIFTMTKTGGWALELQGFYLGTALALVFLGAGRYSLGGANGRWN